MSTSTDRIPPSTPCRLDGSGPSIRRLGDVFEVVGLPSVSPVFPTRAEAGRWLAAQIAELPARLRPRDRRCMCCATEFRSDGPHHRLCDDCRHRDAGPLPTAWARPARRGEGART